MTRGSVLRRLVAAVLGALWAGFLAYGFYAFATTEPSGDGFVRGLNRVEALFGWQGLALLTAIALWIVGRELRHAGRAVHWVTFLPLLVMVAEAVGVGLFILYVVVTAERPPT